MAWPLTGLEHFDDAHRAAAAWTWLWQCIGLVGIVCGVIKFDIVMFRHAKQVAHPCKIIGSVAVGKQAVVTDAMQALGQYVDQKAADNSCGWSVIVV